MEKDFNHLNKWIPKRLAERGWSVEKLANHSGISRTAVYRWMYDDDRPEEETMLKVCRALDVPLEEGLRQYVPKKKGRPGRKQAILGNVSRRS
jgi:transcriptional regulator with XRE-family HTH domain